MAEIIIIGGGAAGMMAAVAAAGAGQNVVLIEKNEKLGKKLFITGKGRCNVTNACEVQDFFQHVMEHAKFLYSAVYGFDNHAVMAFFEQAGCPLKVERGQRVFPQSDHSSDIIRALEQTLRKSGVKVLLNTEVKRIMNTPIEENTETGRKKKQKYCSKVSQIELYDKKTGKQSVMRADQLIVATGGCSYVLTGSTGDGYRFARELGHTVTPCLPALVPFQVREDFFKELQGLSLKNVEVRILDGKKELYRAFGEMLFTHFGVSGPVILTASSHVGERAAGQELKLAVDLKPALSPEQLEQRILREFGEHANKSFKNVAGSLFPSKLKPVMVALSGIHPDKKIHDISREERRRFIDRIKNLEMTITGLRGFSEAIITKGGISVKEIRPSTMESKRVSGLYFAGEVLDLDAETGGFNLQIAWSTGYAAGNGI